MDANNTIHRLEHELAYLRIDSMFNLNSSVNDDKDDSDAVNDMFKVTSPRKSSEDLSVPTAKTFFAVFDGVMSQLVYLYNIMNSIKDTPEMEQLEKDSCNEKISNSNTQGFSNEKKERIWNLLKMEIFKLLSKIDWSGKKLFLSSQNEAALIIDSDQSTGLSKIVSSSLKSIDNKTIAPNEDTEHLYDKIEKLSVALCDSESTIKELNMKINELKDGYENLQKLNLDAEESLIFSKQVMI